MIHMIVLQAKRRREEDLEDALRRLRGENTDISQESAEIKVTFYIIIIIIIYFNEWIFYGFIRRTSDIAQTNPKRP